MSAFYRAMRREPQAHLAHLGYVEEPIKGR